MLCINRLKATSVRNLQELDIEPASQVNYFYGPNASGKTSVLETIYLLSRVKSFRSNRINSVIRHGERSLSVFASGKKHQQPFNVGIEKGHGLLRLKLNGNTVNSASEQAHAFPVFLLAPDHNLLFYGGPRQRRHWLDWSLFHVEQTYLKTWKAYHRALRHRNALLKENRVTEIEGWEYIIGREARRIDELRQGYILKLEQLMNETYLPQVLPGRAHIEYRHSYAGSDLARELKGRRQEDLQRGYTGIGPHRADIRFNFEGMDTARHLSRGQIKLFGAAQVSGQLALTREQGVGAIVLVDDIDAELDYASSQKIMQLMVANGAQTFVSSLSLSEWVPGEAGRHAVFHVEQGRVQPEEK